MADLKAEPWDPEFSSDPLPNAKWDCEESRDFFRKELSPQVLECLRGVGALEVRYRLMRDPQPVLELQIQEDNQESPPQCLRELLPRIPVPREIFFQGKISQHAPVGCYSARLDLEADRLLGLRLPWKRLEVGVQFPLPHSILKSGDEVSQTFTSWVLTPFLSTESEVPEGFGIQGKTVPEAICSKCIGDKNMATPQGSVRQFWPR